MCATKDSPSSTATHFRFVDGRDHSIPSRKQNSAHAIKEHFRQRRLLRVGNHSRTSSPADSVSNSPPRSQTPSLEVKLDQTRLLREADWIAGNLARPPSVQYETLSMPLDPAVGRPRPCGNHSVAGSETSPSSSGDRSVHAIGPNRRDSCPSDAKEDFKQLLENYDRSPTNKRPLEKSIFSSHNHPECLPPTGEWQHGQDPYSFSAEDIDSFRADNLAFYALRYHSACHQEALEERCYRSHSTLLYKQVALAELQERIAAEDSIRDDGLIFALEVLEKTERSWGSAHEADVHLRGLQQMLHARQGAR